eukprot:scaffold10510_cov84-Skeletonema_dohrnii-CCMP3373.AAC.13
MSFPPNVNFPVRISEVLAIVIAIITQEDIRKAVNLLRDGFDQNLPKKFKGATFAKWGLSIALRASEGLLGLFVTFLLIMRSSSVLDLLLNFLAVEFVTMLDDVVFALISEGFLGRSLKTEATKLSKSYYHVSHRSVDSRAALIVTVAYFVVLFTAFFAGWGYIFWKQERGEYLCDQIFAQFGDEVVPMLGTFTGLFRRQTLTFGDKLVGRRSVYKSVYNNTEVVQDGEALLAYCHAKKRWTLSLTEDNIIKPCTWLAASSESVDFDVLTTANSQWVVNTAQKRTVPLAQHFLACHDCIDKLCGHRNCIDKGTCECDPGYYGLRCEYPEPCERLEIDPRDEGFVKTGGSLFATKYYRLQGAKTYNHPVYTSLLDNETLGDKTDILLFTGVRWILSSKYLFPALKDINDASELARNLSQFHGHFTNYSASYVSEPVHIDSPADATASPLRKRWRYSTSDGKDLRLQPDLNKDFIDASFFCAECNNTTNPCSYEAVCLPDGTCSDCPNNSSGAMCQIPPTSNGQCNKYFNNIHFDFDGGDCCDNTCRSTRDNICGKAGGGYIDTGYPWCKGATDLWQLSGDPVYGVSSASRSGRAVALRGKGTILAVADPGVSIVRLFDKDGSEWIQRGQSIQGPPESDFGLAISLSDESIDITRSPLSSPTVTLVVGAPSLKDQGWGLVRVFKCSTFGCMQRGYDIKGDGSFGTSVSITKDGNNIAIGGVGSTDGKEVKVFTWSNNDWQQKGIVEIDRIAHNDPLHRYMQQGYYVSLSGDYLAVGELKSKKTVASGAVSMRLITHVYKWDEAKWVQLSTRIRKNFYFDESFRDQWPLKSVVIKGSVLAIGSKSSADVYSWSETSSKWITREIELVPSDVNGWSVDLSEDASVLAVGTSVENAQPTDESIHMYQWNGTHYRALFNGVPAGPAASVSLSGDGKAVAVGLPFDALKGGSTRVYSFHPSSPCDDPSEIPLRISFTTDASPEETSWELRVDSQIKWSNGPLSVYTTYVEEMCISATSCAKFIVYDSKGDGLSPPGVFSIMLDGTEVARGDGNFGFYDVKSIVLCECQEGEVNFTLAASTNSTPAAADWSLLKKNTTTTTPYNLVASEDSSFIVVDDCIPKDCYYLSLQQNRAGGDDICTVIYNAIYNGVSIIANSTYGEVFCNQSKYEFGECV